MEFTVSTNPPSSLQSDCATKMSEQPMLDIFKIPSIILINVDFIINN